MSDSKHQPHEHSPSRRNFIKSSLAAPLALSAAGVFAADAATTPTQNTPSQQAPDNPLPTRKLGKTGAQVSILNIGGMMSALSPQFYDLAWQLGIRYFDNADCYLGGSSEARIGEFLQQYPERRKDLFLVTKDHPRGGPAQLLEMIDRRLEQLQTDYVDLFFIHGIGPREYGEQSLEWPKNDEFKQVCEKLKASGKARQVGFSCHDGLAPQYLMAAAEGGFVDSIMVAYNPFLEPSSELDRALDACADAGIGLIAMKEMRALGQVPKRVPEFDALGLTTHQAVLQATWSDDRIASICSMMENVQQLQENTEAARKYQKPLTTAQIRTLHDIALAHNPSMCPNCDGRCARACGQDLALNDIARYVTYYERDGNLDAKRLYQNLPAELRKAHGANLAAAREACMAHLDFASILERAERYFG